MRPAVSLSACFISPSHERVVGLNKVSSLQAIRGQVLTTTNTLLSQVLVLCQALSFDTSVENPVGGIRKVISAKPLSLRPLASTYTRLRTERWEAALPSGPAQVKNSPPKNFCKSIPAQGCTTVHACEW
jgi:hypothetical protein